MMLSRILLLLLPTTNIISAYAQEVAEGATNKGAESQSRTLSKPAWVKEDYPNPELSLSACKSKSNRLCDPDGILIDVERDRLVQQIEQAEGGTSVSCGDKENFSVQISMAFCNRMDLIPYGPYEDREQKAAQAFAVHLHNQWGVGLDTPCGGTGVLLFFSIHDRAFYISRGAALNHVLTDKRIDRAMESIKRLLREGDYAKAMSKLLKEVEGYLSKGPPSKNELRKDFLENLTPLAMMLSIFGFVAFKARSDHREARNYAQVESQLSLLDRNRAEALQGRYQCTSCPICLETFKTVEGQDRPTLGSDGQPLKLLRCGHVFDESCWSEWVSSGTGNVRRCPICQQDVGSSNGTQPPPPTPPLDDNNRALRQYNRERHFRLLRLGMRYPRYVRQDQIQRWTESTYEGSLVRDPSFVRTNPRHYANNRNGGSGGSRIASFGGGSSGGGRGGGW